MKTCWKTNPEKRPKIQGIKKKTSTKSSMQKIYKRSDQASCLETNKRNLILQTTLTMKPRTVWIFCMLIFAGLIANGMWKYFTFSDKTKDFSPFHQPPNVTDFTAFLAAASFDMIIKYDIHTDKLSFLADYDKPNVARHTKMKQVAKLNDMVYMFQQENFDNSGPLQLNISDASLARTRLHWKDYHINRNYIAFNDSILAIGARDFKYKFSDEYSTFGITAADLYNTTTGRWTKLHDMNEARAYHSLVAFQGLVCAIGGYEAINSECYNPNSSRCTYLPKMNTMQQGAAAVEFNDELYVIGGARCNDDDAHLQSVEKFNSVHALWTEVAPLNQPKTTDHAAAVFNGKNYVIGGNPRLVEVYDPGNDVWEITGLLNFESDPVFTIF